MTDSSSSNRLLSEADMKAIKKRAHSVCVRWQVCTKALTQEEQDIANLLYHIDALMELPPELRNPTTVRERGAVVLREIEGRSDEPPAVRSSIADAVESIEKTGLIRYTVVPSFEGECDINYDPKGEWVRFEDVWPELQRLRTAVPPDVTRETLYVSDWMLTHLRGHNRRWSDEHQYEVTLEFKRDAVTKPAGYTWTPDAQGAADGLPPETPACAHERTQSLDCMPPEISCMDCGERLSDETEGGRDV